MGSNPFVLNTKYFNDFILPQRHVCYRNYNNKCPGCITQRPLWPPPNNRNHTPKLIISKVHVRKPPAPFSPKFNCGCDEIFNVMWTMSFTHFFFFFSLSFGGGGSISTALPGLRGGVFSFSIMARGASGNGLTVFESMLVCRTFFNESRLVDLSGRFSSLSPLVYLHSQWGTRTQKAQGHTILCH